MTKTTKMNLRRYAIVTMKYVLAVLISLGLAFLLEIPDYLSASFIAVLTLQPTLYRGIEFSWQQIKATVLGVVVTVSLVVVTGGGLHATYWPFQSAVAMGITIGFCLYFQLDEGTVIATFTVAYLTCLPEMIHESFFRTLDLRFITIGIGLTAGLLMNYLSSLFGYRDRLYLNVHTSARQLGERLDDIVGCFSEPDDLERSLKHELKQLRALRQQLNNVEIDLEEIEFRAPGLTDESVSGEQGHQRQFDRIYCLKDFSHHLWSLLLHLVKTSPFDGEHERYVKEELETLEGTYRMVSPGLVDDDHGLDVDEVEDTIEDHLGRLAEQGPEREPVTRYLSNCYQILKDGCGIIRRSGDRN